MKTTALALLVSGLASPPFVARGQDMVFLPYGPSSAELQSLSIRTPSGEKVGIIGAQVVTENEDVSRLVVTLTPTDDCVFTGDKHFRSNIDILETYRFDVEGDQGKNYQYAISMDEIQAACGEDRDLYRIAGEISLACGDETESSRLRRGLESLEARQSQRRLSSKSAKYEVGLGCELLDGVTGKVQGPDTASEPSGPPEPSVKHKPVACSEKTRRGCHDAWMYTLDDSVCVDPSVNPGHEPHCATCATKRTPVHGNAPWGFFVGQFDFRSPRTYHFEINAGARQFCRLDNGEICATVIVETDEEMIRIWIKAVCQFQFKDTNVYIGPTYLPPLPNNWYEIRPEKFPYRHAAMNDVTDDFYAIRINELPESDLYYIAIHAYVCKQA